MHAPELGDDVVTIRIEAFDITRNLTIYSGLGFRLSVAGDELSTQGRQFDERSWEARIYN